MRGAGAHVLVSLQLLSAAGRSRASQVVQLERFMREAGLYSSVDKAASGGTFGGHAEGQGKSGAGSTIRFAEEKVDIVGQLGVMNKAGVTRYHNHHFDKPQRSDGRFFWAGSVNRDENTYAGAKDLSESVSWAWHHPSGVYSTIPVGSPLFDAQMNVYIASDDAIRKFDINGVIKWAYAPRGQLAAAPSLCSASRRQAAPAMDAEALVRPDWVRPDSASDESFRSSRGFKVGDLVKVKAGASYWADGRELFKSGDEGMIYGVDQDEHSKDGKVLIQWTGTGKKSVVQLHSVQERFTRVEKDQTSTTSSSMLVGSTTSGYVFAIDLESGDELWATLASNDIAGVKGSVACKGGIVVAATDRCTDRYCYRYRNATNPLTPGNQWVRGLSAVNGTEVWSFKTFQPTWNMIPLWGPDNSVMFQDWEGGVYSLDLFTGVEKWDNRKSKGDIGTHTHAHAVYSPGHNVIVALGMKHYTTGRCNPYPAPGILASCWTWPGGPGFIRGYNASSGRLLWEQTTPEPPASGAIDMVNAPEWHTRLIVTMAHNCYLGSPSEIWALDPDTGAIRWEKTGPTLWTNFCAGDKEGADIRRAMGGREKCNPNSWSIPVIDSMGDIYVGSHVGALFRYGHEAPMPPNQVDLLSTLTLGVAFQDAAIAIGNGVMAVSTCTSLLVFKTYTEPFSNSTWSVSHSDYSPIQNQVHGEDISHEISEESHDDTSLTPKIDADDIWKNDQPVYDPNIDNSGYGDQQAHSQHAPTAYR